MPYVLLLYNFILGYIIHNWSSVWSHGQGKYLSAAKLSEKPGRLCHGATWENYKPMCYSELLPRRLTKHQLDLRRDLFHHGVFTFLLCLNSFTHNFWVGYSVYAEGKVAHLVDLMFSCVLASAGHWSRSPIGCACSKSPTGEEWHCSDGDQSRGRDSVVGSSHSGRIHIWPWV